VGNFSYLKSLVEQSKKKLNLKGAVRESMGCFLSIFLSIQSLVGVPSLNSGFMISKKKAPTFIIDKVQLISKEHFGVFKKDFSL
jgi:hypothetical protein